MSQFEGFNAENKLRIPLTAYAAQIIDNDCLFFSKRKATLINTIILNYYQEADCSISLRLSDYRNEIADCLSKIEQENNIQIVNKIIQKRADELIQQYTHRLPAEVNWQITLNKRVKELLTNDPLSQEERYYGNRPGRFVRSLLEDYAQLPYYRREEIVYKQMLNTIINAIDSQYVLSLITNRGNKTIIKPYKIATDPLSMYHYVIGYRLAPESEQLNEPGNRLSGALSFRLSRLESAEIQYYYPGKLSNSEEMQITKELEQKGVQFVSADMSSIKIWLSDSGIRKYNSQLHLRPFGIQDSTDDHIFTFECTESQALYYFISFGKDAKVLSPLSLQECFKEIYEEAAYTYL